jgi:hypothetical protein
MHDSVLRSQRFVIGIVTAGHHRKIFQCQFASRDGSVFVSFPYYRHTTGLVSLVAWPAGQPSAVLSLELGGKVSSHLVKYSHHPNGRAHFSQDGRVRTIIRKQSVPLDEVEGHLFSLHVQGLENFDVATAAEENASLSPKRTRIRFSFDEQNPEAVKFVGRLHSASWLQQRAANGIIEPIMPLLAPDGRTRPGLVCSTLIGAPGQDRCLVLSCEPLPRLDQGRASSLVFVAGFDARAAMADTSQPVSFLALSYPAENVDDLRQRLGSIDLLGRDVA